MLSKDNTVSRSRQLIDSKFPTWDVSTLNVFDTYLSRINPLDPESSEVVFTKREYELLLGVSEMRPEQLNKSIRKFMGNTVSIPLERGGWDNFCLFDRARMEKLPSGEWQITLRCHPELRDLFFELKEKGYQKYKLSIALSLNSKYSKLLYYNLKNNQFRGEWIVEIDELRQKIGAVQKTYTEYKEFNKSILKKAVAEINEKTDLNVSYNGIYDGKYIVRIQFIFNEKEIVSEQQSLTQIEENPKLSEQTKFYSEACDFEFSDTQIRELSILASEHIERGLSIDEYEMEIYRYLRKKYLRLKTKADIKNPYGYMRNLVEFDR